MRLHTIILAATAIIASSCGTDEQKTEPQKLNYPSSKTVVQMDDYFGTKVADPYRWLEFDTAADVTEWVNAQRNFTNDYLSKIPFREKFKNRLTEILNYPRYSSPFRAGEYIFFSKNDGLQNQSVIYYQKGNDGEPQVFLDPNTMSDDGTAAVSLAGFSKDKKTAAYTVNQSGSDWQTIYVMDVATKKLLADKIEWVKFSGATWKGNEGFYYSRYDAPEKGKEFSNKNSFQKVYYHKIGDTQDKDVLVYEDKTNPQLYFGTEITEDGKYLVLYISAGTSGMEVKCKDLQNASADFKLLFKGFEYDYGILAHVNGRLLVKTNDGALNQHIITVDANNPADRKVLVPEQDNFLEAASTGGGKLFLTYLKDVSTRVYQCSLDGKQESEILLPGIGTAGGFGAEMKDEDFFYSFTSFTYPPTIYRYEIKTGKSEVWKKTEVKFNIDDFETKQVFYTSKDGTKVPMFIVAKKGIELNGNNPTLLYAYGGFNVNIQPAFNASIISLLENGCVYAVANLRGGGEYGEKWHKGGMLLNKQNVFNDFIAAAEYLISEKYTSKDKLAISGRSNGGLLVGACVTQRPDLYKVCFPGVGVLDMLRFHKFTVGWGWVVEYGSSDSANHFQNLYKFSPLHNVKEIEYPATMITTADHDDRVVPAHSFKFAAEMQKKQKGGNPILIRIDSKAGHGAGKPIGKVIEEVADMYSFMFYQMGIEPNYK
jgi:prolyl oligopeptidase